MILGGLQRFSMVDFPDTLSAVLFTRGCNFRCPYCHNPELVEPSQYRQPVNEDDVFSFLDSRRGKLQGIVITGGEPTLHDDLPDLCRRIKEKGFRLKLDTNGTRPGMLRMLIERELVDYIAMDIKAPCKKYDLIARTHVDAKVIGESIDLIRESGVDCEFRTTVVRGLLEPSDLLQIQRELGPGVRYFIQKFDPTSPLDQSLTEEQTFSPDILGSLLQAMEPGMTAIR